MSRSASAQLPAIGVLVLGLSLFLATLCDGVKGDSLRTVCRNESVVEAVVDDSVSCMISWFWTECPKVNKTIVKEVCYNVTDIRQLPPLPTTPSVTTPSRQPDPPARKPDPPARQPDPPARQPNPPAQQTDPRSRQPAQRPEPQLVPTTPRSAAAQTGYGQGAGSPDMRAALLDVDINSLPIVEISKIGKDGCYNETRLHASYEEDPDCYFISRLWNGCWRPANRTIVMRRCKGTLAQRVADDEATDGKLTDAEILSVATITTLVVAIAITIVSITAKQRLRRRKHGATEDDLKVYERATVDSMAGTPASPVYKSTTYKPAASSLDPTSPLLHKPAVGAAGGLPSGAAAEIPLLPTNTDGGCSEQPAAAIVATTSCADGREPPSDDWDNCRETRA